MDFSRRESRTSASRKADAIYRTDATMRTLAKKMLLTLVCASKSCQQADTNARTRDKHMYRALLLWDYDEGTFYNAWEMTIRRSDIKPEIGNWNTKFKSLYT